VLPPGEARSRHRALASDGLDADVAADLDAAARAALARAAPAAAVELLDQSLQHSPPAGADRDRRGIRLGQAVKLAGDPTGAARILDGVVADASSSHARAAARLELAAIWFESGTPIEAVALCEAAIEDAEGDQELLARAHATLAAVDWDDFRRGAEHVKAAVEAIAQVPAPDPAVLGLVLLVQVGAEFGRGEPLNAALVQRALDLEAIAPAPSVADRMSASLGTWLKLDDRLEDARLWLERSHQAAIDEGDEGSIPYLLSHLPQLELWTGDWARSEALAREHIASSVELGLESQRRQGSYNLAAVLASQGRVDEVRPLIADTLAAALADGDRWTEAGMLAVLGMLELSLGNPAAAAEPLARAGAIRDAMGNLQPRRSDTDLVEALVATGDVEQARAVAIQATERARLRDRPSALALAALAGAIVSAADGDLDGAIEALEEALRNHDAVAIPFDRARTLLVLGQVRRRRRERGLARAALEDARDTFEHLGARLWTERTRAEIDRLGIRRSAGESLTETERRVAELTASGMTNRAVAAALFVSPKTVEANLARAYQKLGITTRAELGARMAKESRPQT
jgi:DNA-binding CsgD family transcriptional regulator